MMIATHRLLNDFRGLQLRIGVVEYPDQHIVYGPNLEREP